MKEKLVFVLGDSRTGTSSMNSLLNALGYYSIHYYPVEAKQFYPKDEYSKQNWDNLLEFIRSSEYNAFTDYPTRIFFRELHGQFPDASFILTVRRDLATWKKSVQNYFRGNSRSGEGIELRGQVYEEVNAEIRSLFKDRKILEICIDDDSKANEMHIKQFLGESESTAVLTRENQSALVNFDTLFSTEKFFKIEGNVPDILAQIKNLSEGALAVPSESGWIYILNDETDFLSYQFGSRSWLEHQLVSACTMLRNRVLAIEEMGSRYFQFVIPEKSVIYREYLPSPLCDTSSSELRPAKELGKMSLPGYAYLDEEFERAKSMGSLYFRGGSSLNWLGNYFLYLRVIWGLKEILPKHVVPALPMLKLASDKVSFEGDLYQSLSASWREKYRTFFSGMFPSYGIEEVTKFGIDREEFGLERSDWTDKYRRFVDQSVRLNVIGYRNRNGTGLPRALVFQESAEDLLMDCLSISFGETCYVEGGGRHLIFEIIKEYQPNLVIQLIPERYVSNFDSMPALLEA